ncbi:PD-(D/E)XK nuclease family protein [Mycolicibacterium sp. F2034L]|uniref:PD-(D/E)XK nuclease family protein n=1 Tax=Mycolicibacterium sp. F2034L TaxID=2926422 RepID=UPI001FF20487|nr:PD-(D/E)XK nuclease family protein [Mycolicibacterium sp. F2034L]MCK0174782.1 PD-(D/E)XK nuclease family protein [Mycolicibacterium sp. F2034L]
MTTTELQNTEIPRDRFGRPMVMPTGRGKKRVAYRRATTFVGCLDDMNGLMKWKARQVALGMGQRKDLVLAAAAANPDDKKLLGEIAEKATEHALSSAGATTGTALHSLTERIDRGQNLGYVPAEYEADLEAYQKATAEIEFIGIEAFRVHDDWKVAGTADRIGRLHGRLMIMDIKTGSIDYPHKMAMQLAMYAHSTPYDIPTDTRQPVEEGLNPNQGIIIHLPAGEGRCDLYEIDLNKGWAACVLAKKVWDWRGTKELTRLIDPAVAPPKPPTWYSLTEAATTVEDLRLIWTRAKECGDLTAELKAALTERNEQLHGVA